MPAGKYEARLFYNNSYDVEDKVEFSVSGKAFGAAGPFLYKVKSAKTREIRVKGKVVIDTIIYYPKGEMNLPTIIFMGGGQQELKKYDGFLRHVASLGFCVIAKFERGKYVDPSKDYAPELSQLLPVARDTYHADISKLGIMGHSSGGGTMYVLMDYFKTNHIAGNTKSAIVSIDGWFPFGTTKKMLNNLNTPTLLMQFGGFESRPANGIHNKKPYKGKHYHHKLDPKIYLGIFKLLTYPNLDKEYIVLDSNDHLRVEGDYDTIKTRLDLLAPIDEFISHTLVTDDVPMNLIDQSDKVIKYHPSDYQYTCDSYGYNFCHLNDLKFPK